MGRMSVEWGGERVCERSRNDLVVPRFSSVSECQCGQLI